MGGGCRDSSCSRDGGDLPTAAARRGRATGPHRIGGEAGTVGTPAVRCNRGGDNGRGRQLSTWSMRGGGRRGRARGWWEKRDVSRRDTQRPRRVPASAKIAARVASSHPRRPRPPPRFPRPAECACLFHSRGGRRMWRERAGRPSRRGGDARRHSRTGPSAIGRPAGGPMRLPLPRGHISVSCWAGRERAISVSRWRYL